MTIPDDDIHQHIDELVAEEHRLRAEAASDEHRQRLADLERRLDRLWDLLRRRQAAREFGQDASTVTEQPTSQVEGYLQ